MVRIFHSPPKTDFSFLIVSFTITHGNRFVQGRFEKNRMISENAGGRTGFRNFFSYRLLTKVLRRGILKRENSKSGGLQFYE